MHIKSSPTPRTMTPFAHVSWRTTAITAALGVLLCTAHLDAQALALGRLTTLSALGEPLRAEIDVPEINAEEFTSFKATMATPEAFRAAGMEYNAALASTQFILQRRTNGTAFIQLRSDKAVSDPFVNLVINANWASGRIIRNYTLLLDPPTARQSDTASTITAPITSLSAPKPVPASAPAVASTPPADPVSRPTNAEAKAAAAPTPKQATMPEPKPAAVPRSGGEQYKVASGDTAGKIAAANKPANVSLDQMLVAMLRGNPEAFIDKNVHRLKAGSVLSMPTIEETQAISDSVARQDVIAQSKDFNNFRRKLAENTPSIPLKAPDRQAGGKIEAKVEERKSAAVTPDKLTLSKGSLNGDAKAAAGAKDNSEKIAKERQSKEDSTRVAELSKNISDLNKIASGSVVSPASPPANVVSATAPGATTATQSVAPAATGAVAVTPPAVASAAASATATTPAKPVTAPVVTPDAAAPTTSPVPNATTVAAANAGATPPAPATAAVTPVAPAKPKTAPPVPVPEPDFIDGLMDNPIVLPAAGGLLALLLGGGMYVANQRKKRAAEDEDDEKLENEFEDQSSFFNTAHHEPVSSPVPAAAPAPDAPISAPEPLFTLPPLPVQIAPVFTQAASEVTPEPEPEPMDAFLEMPVSEFSARTVAQLDPESAKSPAPVDLDLDFDFDVSAFHYSAKTAAAMAAVAPAEVAPAADLDFEITPTKPTTSPLPAHSEAAVAVETSALAPAPAASVEPDRGGMIEFDLDNLSLDLNATNQSAGSALAIDNNGPLETKLALAQEFRAIGDTSGAKMLAQEVIALASGSLKTKAENLLAEMG